MRCIVNAAALKVFLPNESLCLGTYKSTLLELKNFMMTIVESHLLGSIIILYDLEEVKYRVNSNNNFGNTDL